MQQAFDSFSNILLLFLIILSFSSSNSILYPSFNEYHGRELGTTTMPWILIGFTSPTRTINCNNSSGLSGEVIGSYNGYLERKYSFLPKHDVVYFQIQLYVLNTWKSSNSLQIFFDGKEISASNIGFDKGSFPSNICGLKTNDSQLLTIVGKLAHKIDTITLKVKIRSYTGSSNASFAITDISLLLANSTSKSIKDDSCFHAIDSLVKRGANAKCRCQAGTYPDPFNSNQCLSCDSSCMDCYGSSSTQCYVCSSGHFLVDTQCTQCHSSCGTCFGPNSCITCKNGLWLHKTNNSCLNFCNSPAEYQEDVSNFKLCLVPCLSSEFILWDKTCNSSCTAPLISRVQGTTKYCDKPCQDGDFYYLDHTCRPDCNFPLTQAFESRIPICKSDCNNGEFLHPNGSCLLTCPHPFLVNSIGNISLCKFPCKFEEGEFLLWNGSCTTECFGPYFQQRIENEFRYCDARLDEAEKRTINQVTQAVTATGKIASVGTVISSIASGGPSALSLISLVKMLHYIRYLSIEYPPKVLYLFQNQNSTSISLNLSPDIPEIVEEEFTRHPLPAKFGEYNLSSSFFVNYWETFFTLGLVGAVILASSFFAFLGQKYNYRYVYLISLKIKNITKWDLFLFVFCSSYDGIAFFSFFEVLTINNMESWTCVATFIASIVMNIIAMYVVFRTLCTILRLRKIKCSAGTDRESQKYMLSQTNWRTFQILFRGFKDETFLQQAFMLFFLSRIYIADIIISYMYQYPLLQSIILMLMSFLMLFYLIIKRPFKERSNLVEYITYEFIILIVNAIVLTFAIFDSMKIEALSMRIFLGDIIIICNIVFNVFGLLFFAFELIFRLIKAYKIIKAHKGKQIFTSLILLIFEKDGMALEEYESSKDQVTGKRENRTKFIKKLDISNRFQESFERPFNKSLSNVSHSSLRKIFPIEGRNNKIESSKALEVSLSVISEDSPNRLSARKIKSLKQSNLDQINESIQLDDTDEVEKKYSPVLGQSPSSSLSPSPSLSPSHPHSKSSLLNIKGGEHIRSFAFNQSSTKTELGGWEQLKSRHKKTNQISPAIHHANTLSDHQIRTKTFQNSIRDVLRLRLERVQSMNNLKEDSEVEAADMNSPGRDNENCHNI